MTTTNALATYQPAALSTAQPRAFHHDYLIPGIAGEVGELYSHVAKAYWHEKDRSDLINGEYGDIAWMTALLLHTYGVDRLPVPAVNISDGARAMYRIHCLSNELLLHFTEVEDPRISGRFISNAAQRLWFLLEQSCEAVTGVPFDGVLAMNLAKLQSRAERGVLQGDGDKR
jgi:hypothetical protein